MNGLKEEKGLLQALFLKACRIRCLTITLLELLLVIAILAMVSGIVVVSINKALVDQRFRTEVDLIVNEMRLAQDLMLILGTDVHLNFSEDESGSGIKYWISLETSLPKNVQKEVLRKRKPLTTIHGVFLNDELVFEVKEKHIDVKFLSKGAIMSKGIMRLASSDQETPQKGVLEKYICLAGYPRPIHSSDTKEEAERDCVAFEEDLDERLTKDTILRLPERLQELNTKSKPIETPDKAEPKSQEPPQDKKPLRAKFPPRASQEER